MNLVSIVLPTYNRKRFLETAFKSIKEQTYENWELIIVDDGSSDGSMALLTQLKSSVTNTVTVIQQDNAGPAVARNAGIRQAIGVFIAFFDSDDYWLPHHLNDCISAFEHHPEIDWVYGACKRIDFVTKVVVLESTFYNNSVPNPLFSLNAKVFEKLHIIDDENAARCQIIEGIDSGLQNSVIKATVFNKFVLPEFRIGEDRLFILMALKSHFTLAFIDNIHVHYNVHDDNLSDTSAGDERFDRRIVAMRRLLTSYEHAHDYVELNSKEQKYLNKRLALDYFWKLGYSLQYQAGYYKDAINTYKIALNLCPYTFKFWKTYLFALMQYKLKGQTPEDNKTKLLVLGDSHVETFKRMGIQQAFPQHYFKVVSVGGATVSGLQSPNSKTQALPIFRKNIADFSPHTVLIQLGEVDTGFVIWYRAEKYQLPVEEMLTQAINNYCDLLYEIANQAQIVCLGTVMPTIKDGQDWGEIANARKEVKATQLQRTDLTIRFNQAIQQYCMTKNHTFISLDESSLDENGLVADFLINSCPNDRHYDQSNYANLLVKHLSLAFNKN